MCVVNVIKNFDPKVCIKESGVKCTVHNIYRIQKDFFSSLNKKADYCRTACSLLFTSYIYKIHQINDTVFIIYFIVKLGGGGRFHNPIRFFLMD